jgi:signal transduction histidine kinase
VKPEDKGRRRSPIPLYKRAKRLKEHEENPHRQSTAPRQPSPGPKQPKYPDLREAFRRLDHLYEISKLLTRFESPEETVLGVLGVATRTLSLRSAVLVEMPPHRERVIVWRSHGLTPSEAEEAKTHAVAATAYFAGPNPPNLAPNVLESGIHLLPGPGAAGSGEKVVGSGRFIVLPLLVGRPPAFGAFQVEGKTPFSEADLGFVTAITTQLAIALDRYNARERAREAGRRLELLVEAGRLTASPLDTEATLGRVAEVAVREMADCCTIHLLQEGREVRRFFARSRKAPREGQEDETARLLEAVAAKVVETGRSVAESTRRFANGNEEAPSPSLYIVAAPILGSDRTLGAVTLVRTDSDEPYVQDDLEMVEDLAHRIALAVERNLAVDKVHELNATLEQHVLERTTKLQQVVIELNAFAYSVAHDLRAPLRAMQGLSQALLEDYGSSLEEAGRDYARRIAESSVRMDALIQDLLAYANLAQIEVELEPIELGSLLRKVLGEMAGELKERKAEVTIEEPLPRCLGYARALGQALTNLISNAAKFVPPGVDPRIRVRAECRDGWCRLWIEDNGIGIPREYQAKVFGVFQRLHKPGEYQGTGIGLAIVRKAMERMGGRWGVESEPGKGSRFFIELPEVRTEL